MKKSNFVSLVMGTVGGLLFGIGMCMCLMAEWGAFRQGIVVGVAGVVVLLAMLVVRRRMQGKPAIRFSGRALATVALGIVGTLILGVGLCMTMVWQGMMMPGIIVGIVGILALVALVPACKGIVQ